MPRWPEDPDAVSPLEAWCSRNPRVRWPLVFIALLLLWGIAGSGDLPY